jgi:hypothetical protein
MHRFGDSRQPACAFQPWSPARHQRRRSIHAITEQGSVINKSMNRTTKILAAGMVTLYAGGHVIGGVDVPTKPLTMLVQVTASTSNNATMAMPDMTTTQNRTFDLRPPVDVRLGRLTIVSS